MCIFIFTHIIYTYTSVYVIVDFNLSFAFKCIITEVYFLNIF